MCMYIYGLESFTTKLGSGPKLLGGSPPMYFRFRFTVVRVRFRFRVSIGGMVRVRVSLGGSFRVRFWVGTGTQLDPSFHY